MDSKKAGIAWDATSCQVVITQPDGTQERYSIEFVADIAVVVPRDVWAPAFTDALIAKRKREQARCDELAVELRRMLAQHDCGELRGNYTGAYIAASREMFQLMAAGYKPTVPET